MVSFSICAIWTAACSGRWASRSPKHRRPKPAGLAASQTSRLGTGLIELVRQDEGIETRLEVCVPEDVDLELRRITLRNLSDRPRRLELTSYAEVVLNALAADAAHPAFSKMFVQTEWAAEPPALLARRRPRVPDEPPCWLVHALIGAETDPKSIQYETDRARFLGRGYTLAAPRALVESDPLSGTVGNVLDPIVSLRRSMALATGGEVQITFLLGAAADVPARRSGGSASGAGTSDALRDDGDRPGNTSDGGPHGSPLRPAPSAH